MIKLISLWVRDSLPLWVPEKNVICYYSFRKIKSVGKKAENRAKRRISREHRFYVEKQKLKTGQMFNVLF